RVGCGGRVGCGRRLGYAAALTVRPIAGPAHAGVANTADSGDGGESPAGITPRRRIVVVALGQGKSPGWTARNGASNCFRYREATPPVSSRATAAERGR